jgi:hypothetical protein
VLVDDECGSTAAAFSGSMTSVRSLALALVLTLAGCHKPIDDTPRPAASAPALLAPDMSADASRWLNGGPATLAAARGSVVLIEAWDSACVPCRESVPAVLALRGRFGARGLRVIGVTAFDDTPRERQILLDIAAEEQMTYPSYLDLGSIWQHAAGTSGMIPMFLVVDRGGHIAFTQRGLLREGLPGFESLTAAIERALAGT